MSAGQRTVAEARSAPVALEVHVTEPRRRPWHPAPGMTRYHLDGDGVRSDGPHGPTRDAWSVFTGFRATGDAYELMVGRRRRFVISRSQLEGQSGTDAALGSMLSARLPRR
jgi:hypothetical protein